MRSVSNPSQDASADFSDRYGNSADTRQPVNSVIASLLNHRSVRAYSREPLPVDTLDQMIGAAQSASSSSNLQLWSAVAVNDVDRRQRMSALAGGQRYILEAPLFLVWLADLSRSVRVGEAQGAALEGVAYMESFVTAVVDTSLAAQNAAVAAEAIGLGVVYIGAVRNHPQELARELGLPSLVMPLFGMCVGWPDEHRRTSVKPRLAQSTVLHREQYDTATELRDVDAYDAAMLRFQADQDMLQQGWSPAQTERLRTAASLGGRDKLRAAIHERGFDLR